MADEEQIQEKRKTVKFTNVRLVNFTRDSGGGKANFKASLTKDVMKALQWPEGVGDVAKTSPGGELHCSVIELIPKDQGKAITLDSTKISNFTTLQKETEGTRQKSKSTELHFTVFWNDTTGAKKLEAYILTTGKSDLKTSYTLPPVQQDLPGTEETEVEDDGQEEFEQ